MGSGYSTFIPPQNVYNVGEYGGAVFDHQKHELIHIVPRQRTLRKAREQVKCMVIDGVSPFKTRNYLNRWVIWWVIISDTWHYLDILQQFMDVLLGQSARKRCDRFSPSLL